MANRDGDFQVMTLEELLPQLRAGNYGVIVAYCGRKSHLPLSFSDLAVGTMTHEKFPIVEARHTLCFEESITMPQVALSLAIASFLVLCLGWVTGGLTTRLLFCVYGSPWTDPADLYPASLAMYWAMRI